MGDEIKKTISNFSSNAVGNIIGQVIAFITLLYLPRVLGPNGYGIFNIAQSYLAYFMLLSDFGLSLYGIRIINQNKSSDKKNTVNQIFSLKLIISFIATIIFIITIFFMHVNEQQKLSLFCISFSVLFSGMTVDYLFNAFSNMKYIGVSIALKNITFFGLCLLFVKNVKQTYLTSFAFTLSVFIGMLVLYLIFSRKYFKLHIVIPIIYDLRILYQSLPLAVSSFMVQINNNFDIIYLSMTKPSKEVGFYSAPYKIIYFLFAIMSIYFNAAYPAIAKLFNQNRKKLNLFINKFFRLGVLFTTPIVFGGIALSPNIIQLLFGNLYRPSIILFDLLLPLIFIRMFTNTFGAVLIMGKGSKYLTVGVMIGAIINVVLNILLTPSFGAIGSAWATILCESIQGIYLYIKYRKYCSSKLLKYQIIPLISSVFMFLILLKLEKCNLIISLSTGIIAYFLFYFIISIIIRTFFKIRNKKDVMRHEEIN